MPEFEKDCRTRVKGKGYKGKGKYENRGKHKGWYKNGKYGELPYNPELVENTYYVNDVANPLTQVLMTYDGQDKYRAAYAYGLDRIEVQAVDDTRPESQDPLYYLHDGLGSVTQMVRPNGEVRDHYSYDEFGVPAPGAKLSEDGRNVNHNTFGYTGESWDEENDLLYLRSRYYQPEMGRFISRDTFAGFTSMPQTQHKYSYVNNNSINKVDPSGLIDTRPIVFLHGLDGDGNTFKTMVDKMAGYNGAYDAGVLIIDESGNISKDSTYLTMFDPNSKGRPMIRVAFQSNEEHIAVQTLWFDTAMDRILSDSGYYQVDTVTHSMGGLTALSYIQSFGCPGGIATNHIRNLLTLAAPYGGSKTAWAGISDAARDLRPGSDALKRLSQGMFPDDLKIMAWAGELDAYVSEESAKEVFQWIKKSKKPTKCKIETATIPDAGHMSIHEMDEVARLVKAKLFS
ncbi:MAG: alpha/beta hydrolase [Eubacteriales bacterium]